MKEVPIWEKSNLSLEEASTVFSCLRLIFQRWVIYYAFFHEIDCRYIRQRSQDFDEFGIAVKEPCHYAALAMWDDFDRL